MNTLIFVYGTLKRGQCRDHLLVSSRFVGIAKTQPLYRLYSVGGMYPALVEATQSGVCLSGVNVEGEVYEVASDVLGQLDAVEGVDVGLYERRPVTLLDFEGAVETYFWCGSLDGLTDIGGCWADRSNE